MEKIARQKMSSVPLLYIREKLIWLLKRYFAEAAIETAALEVQVTMTVFFHIDIKSAISHFITSRSPADILSF